MLTKNKISISKYFCVFLFLFTLIVFSCNTTQKKVDVEEIEIPEITINRLEQDLFKMDTSSIKSETKKLELKYGNFYKTFVTGIINDGGIRDTNYANRIRKFISDKDMLQAYKDCQSMFPSTKELTEKFSQPLKVFHYYFPQKTFPKLVTMMSGFNYQTIFADSTLAIGLEMYLGSGSVFYQMLALPNYKTAFMNKENILPDAVRNWIMNEFSYNMSKNDFLSQIIYFGKIAALENTLLPEVSDTLKFQYTQKQMEYCEQNEFNMWSYFIAQKTLYTTNQSEINKFINDGPFTSAFSKNSAPRVGYLIGSQIVKSYLKNNPSESLETLMNQTDAQFILSKSKYKPKKN